MFLKILNGKTEVTNVLKMLLKLLNKTSSNKYENNLAQRT